jgi:uncharacterized membrane protein (UPF0136 family)
MATYILAVYIVFLLLGGTMGYLKAGSKVSLITALVSAAALAVCGYGPVPRGALLVAIIQGVLAAVFVARFLKTRKFMPAGLMVIVTVLALVLGLVVKS